MFSVIEKGVDATSSVEETYSRVVHITTSLSCQRTHSKNRHISVAGHANTFCISRKTWFAYSRHLWRHL